MNFQILKTTKKIKSPLFWHFCVRFALLSSYCRGGSKRLEKARKEQARGQAQRGSKRGSKRLESFSLKEAQRGSRRLEKDRLEDRLKEARGGSKRGGSRRLEEARKGQAQRQDQKPRGKPRERIKEQK